MADVTYGGVIPNKGVNLTAIGADKMVKGTWVEISGPYQVSIPMTRGSLSICGYVLIGNDKAGGDVTIASKFTCIDTFAIAEDVEAGDPIVVGDNGVLYVFDSVSSPGSGDDASSIVGIALTNATAGGAADIGLF